MQKLGADIEEIAYEGQPSSVYFGLPLYEKVDVQEMIRTAVAEGKQELTLPRGAYRIKPKGGAHIVLHGVKNFTLHGNGSVLLYDDIHYTGMHIAACEDVTVEDLHTDYEPFGYAQCKIAQIDPTGEYLEFTVDRGYMADFSGGPYHCPHFPTMFYNGRTRRLMRLRPFPVSPSTVKEVGERRFRAYAPLSEDHRTLLSVGDYFVATLRPISAPALSVYCSGGIRIRNFTVWSGEVGVAEFGSFKKNYYDGFCVLPGPRPYGASEERLMSTVADGAHMPNNYVGATIENGIFHSMGDDGVNFYGHFCRVAEVISPTEFVMAKRVDLGHREGDRLRFYTADTHLIGESETASGELLRDYEPKLELSKALGAVNFRARLYSRVKLKTPITISAGDWVYNADCVGSGFVLRNNRYFNLPPRGALIKASDGLIENCVFEDVGSAGVQIRPELSWAEAGYSHNVTVRNNLFVCAGGERSAALCVEGHAARDQRSILLEGNEFIDTPGTELWITSATGVTVRANRFGLGNRGRSDKPCVRLGAAEEITFSENRFADPTRVRVAAGGDASAVTGETVRLCSIASDALKQEKQGADGWHFGYAPIGTHTYTDFPCFCRANDRPEGWHASEDGRTDDTHGCILRHWGDVYMCPGETQDVAKTYICPKDGRVLLGANGRIIPGEPTEDGICLSVLCGERLLWETTVYSGQLLEMPPIPVTVQKGDAIHFRANKNKTAAKDGLDWDPCVLYLD